MRQVDEKAPATEDPKRQPAGVPARHFLETLRADVTQRIMMTSGTEDNGCAEWLAPSGYRFYRTWLDDKFFQIAIFARKDDDLPADWGLQKRNADAATGKLPPP